MKSFGLALRRVEQDLGESAPNPGISKDVIVTAFLTCFLEQREKRAWSLPYKYELQASILLPGDETQFFRFSV